jgi:hypothetical protein
MSFLSLVFLGNKPIHPLIRNSELTLLKHSDNTPLSPFLHQCYLHIYISYTFYGTLIYLGGGLSHSKIKFSVKADFLMHFCISVNSRQYMA